MVARSWHTPGVGSTPTTAQRVAFGLSAIVVLVLGLVAIVVLLIASEELAGHNGQMWGPAFQLLPVVVTLTLLSVGALLGLALVPGVVVERGQRRTFSLASALAMVALGFAIPTPLALFTWPLGAVAAIAAFVLFRRTRRSGHAAATS